MIYSKQVYQLADDIVSNYAKYKDGFYQIDVTDLPDFVVSDFASLLMSQNDSWAAEATGPDNPSYDKKMLPALQRYMSNPTDKDLEIEFKDAWLEGTTNYFRKEIQEILNDSCTDYTHDEAWEQGLVAKKHSDNGEIYWAHI